ncbi:MAG: hypothetical protein JRN58_05045 [Nitrososphaerota archaeon]|nr:hypothetical protein [Nitrososphaerota archaeon]MDG6967352.1 hypothetical protein [Nitrososphaerota archaeon]MDG6978430.1 hypothetical protein [Nitrososphaerota archaeon]
MDSIEKIAVPMLIMQAISVVFLWTINTLPIDGQTIFLMFLSADFLAFGLIAHVWLSNKTGTPARKTTLYVWGLAVVVFLAAGFVAA